MGCYVSIKSREGTYERFAVQKEVYTYIIQLENKIKKLSIEEPSDITWFIDDDLAKECNGSPFMRDKDY